MFLQYKPFLTRSHRSNIVRRRHRAYYPTRIQFRLISSGVASIFLVLLVGYALIQSRCREIVYDFSEEKIIEGWQVMGAAKAIGATPEGFAIEVNAPVLLILHPCKGEQKELGQLRWLDIPYVKIDLEPDPENLAMILM